MKSFISVSLIQSKFHEANLLKNLNSFLQYTLHQRYEICTPFLWEIWYTLPIMLFQIYQYKPCSSIFVPLGFPNVVKGVLEMKQWKRVNSRKI